MINKDEISNKSKIMTKNRIENLTTIAFVLSGAALFFSLLIGVFQLLFHSTEEQSIYFWASLIIIIVFSSFVILIIINHEKKHHEADLHDKTYMSDINDICNASSIPENLKAELGKIALQPPRQESTLNQLMYLHAFADRLGLHDAADLIKSMTNKK